jgi:hypothetical protein
MNTYFKPILPSKRYRPQAGVIEGIPEAINNGLPPTFANVVCTSPKLMLKPCTGTAGSLTTLNVWPCKASLTKGTIIKPRAFAKPSSKGSSRKLAQPRDPHLKSNDGGLTESYVTRTWLSLMFTEASGVKMAVAEGEKEKFGRTPGVWNVMLKLALAIRVIFFGGVRSAIESQKKVLTYHTRVRLDVNRSNRSQGYTITALEGGPLESASFSDR